MPAENQHADEVPRTSVRFPPGTEDLLLYLDYEIERKRERGEKSDRTNEIRIAIRHRQLARMDADKRKLLMDRLEIRTRQDDQAGQMELGESE